MTSRETVLIPPRKCANGWVLKEMIGGKCHTEVVTSYTLFNQRFYSLDGGVWTRPKNAVSCNSLEGSEGVRDNLGASLEHNIDGRDCWCQPSVEIVNGAGIVTHNDKH